MKATNRDDESEILQRYYNFSNIIPLGGSGGPEKDRVFVIFTSFFTVSPREFVLPAVCLWAGW